MAGKSSLFKVILLGDGGVGELPGRPLCGHEIMMLLELNN